MRLIKHKIKLGAAGFLFVCLNSQLFAAGFPVPVTFTNTTGTIYGQSVFVLGNIPELGGWSPTNAIKMLPSNCVSSNCLWSVTIGIPEGTGYEYKFVKRDDCTNCLGNNTNIIYEPGANRTNATPAGPPAPFAGKSVFYYSGWTNISLIYSNRFTGWTNKAMTAVGPGRSAGEKLWRADNINTPGQPNLIFVFSDNNGHFDNPDGVNGRNYETPLDAFAVQDGQVFNYWPPASVSAPSVTNLGNFMFTNLPSRTVRVYLPRGYNENTNKHYPVLYMHDGQNLFLGMAGLSGFSWNADTNATQLIRYGRVREIIIVGVNSSSDGATRISEYKTPECGGTGDKYAALLINELKPYIDARYRTLPDADNTGAWGSSMGGLISTYLGWQFPNTFRKIGAMSTAFWQCNATATNLASAPKRPLRIYLDSGDQDSQGFGSDGLVLTMQARDNLLLNGYVLNVDADHVIGYTHTHSEQWWCVRSPRCFQFLFPTSDEPNTILDTAAPLRITSFAWTNNMLRLAWPSFRARSYTLQGSTNLNPSAWSNLLTFPAEPRPWNQQAATTNGWRYFRIQQQPAPGWAN